jgi:hypothetical protein
MKVLVVRLLGVHAGLEGRKDAEACDAPTKELDDLDAGANGRSAVGRNTAGERLGSRVGGTDEAGVKTCDVKEDPSECDLITGSPVFGCCGSSAHVFMRAKGVDSTSISGDAGGPTVGDEAASLPTRVDDTNECVVS